VREQAENALRQAQKMEAVGQLTGGVAHDFNNLLTIIKSSVELLSRPNVTEERRKRYTDAISETADRAAKLTAQLLAFARRQPLKAEHFDLAGQLLSSLPILRTTTGSRINVLTDAIETGGEVEVDRNQFDTAILNMIVNARDAMPEGGEITIATGTSDRIPAVRNHAEAPGDYVTVTI
ncbi:histidine kinase dimerization/phospho-acceptor domain-containing protein, partial [Sphingomonas lacusdianchii]|uniref:histidine kinase dimerization/phospho-acceptor domain-containing protein n=1 Tax=Sphingomonas lacusdianchii TaxID=2917992 RepID=UPI002412D70D